MDEYVVYLHTIAVVAQDKVVGGALRSEWSDRLAAEMGKGPAVTADVARPKVALAIALGVQHGIRMREGKGRDANLMGLTLEDFEEECRLVLETGRGGAGA